MLTWSLLSALWSSVLLIVIMAHSGDCSECEVYYLDQPINEFTCDPFLSGVKLECTIYHTNDKTYDIYWYKIPIPMGVETVDPELVNIYRDGKHTNTINYFGGKLIKSQFDIPSSTARRTDVAGYVYWCQVVLLHESRQASSNGSFKASSPFLLHSPEWYSSRSFPPCSDLYQSQPNSTCAKPHSSPSRPPAASDIVSTSSPTQIVTFFPNQGSVTDTNSNSLPPWGYAVIAGGGVASMIIITVILCILLAFCQSLQKYKTRPPLELEDAATSAHGSSHGQHMGQPPLPMRNFAARVPPYHIAMIRREPDPSEYFEMQPVSIRGMAIAGPPSTLGAFQTGSHQGIIGLPQGDEWRKSSRIGHRQSSSTASSSTVEINDHIYHTIDQLEDEAYHSPTESTDDIALAGATAQNMRPRLLCRSSQSLRGPVKPESIAKPQTPPPRLLNSPRSTAYLKTSKLPLVPSSQSVRIISSSTKSQLTESATTAADQETARESPPRPIDAIELKQKQHQARESTETNDYVSLCSTPRTSAVI